MPEETITEPGIGEQGIALRTQQLDTTVGEVFGLMLGVVPQVVRGDRPELQEGNVEPQALSAIVGFAGAMIGNCLLRSSNAAARRMAECMLGMPFEQVDGTVMDAFGEITNMLAGAWKNKIPELTSACMLSVPTVVSGEDYQMYSRADGFRIERQYAFEEHVFLLTLLSDTPL